MMFAPGDEVVCVDAGPIKQFLGLTGTPSGLVEGAHYTVTSFWPAGTFDPRDGCRWDGDGVDLAETQAPTPAFGFAAERFRKVGRKRDLKALLLGEPIQFEGPKRIPQRVDA